ncbi:MAG: hypothetical protein EA379_11790 [Phycisphaerales bacterium]|nr:MAG: hypothetical protein EA379_11790 [Phycisphaerales bacterium]
MTTSAPAPAPSKPDAAPAANPTPDAKQNPIVARCVLAEKHDDHVILSVPGTDYRMRLVIDGPIPHEAGKRIRGVIRAQARRIDVVNTGGRYVEPVYGRPRRIQGTVCAIDPGDDTVCVQVHQHLPIVCRTNGHQRATEFRVGQFVSFDAQPGATFTPVD